MQLKKLLSGLMGAFLAAGCLAGCSGNGGSDLKVVSSKTVELGETVSLNPSEYLLETPGQDVLEEITVDSDLKTDPKYSYNDFSQTVSSAGKDYLAKGVYQLTLKYKGQDYPVTLTIKDTEMPEFISPAAVITVPVGSKDFDVNKVYRTSDKDEVTLKVNGDYDIETVGTYPVTLVATDASGNTNSLEVTINVVGKNQPIKAADQFDNEMVPNDNSQSGQGEQGNPSNGQDQTSQADSSQAQPETPTDQTQTPSDQNPSGDGTSTSPNGSGTACGVSNAPAGSQMFSTFAELYAAGTAWNQQSPNNYFYYLEGTDDCGNKVYFLTTGTQDLVPDAPDGSGHPIEPGGVTQPDSQAEPSGEK